MKITPKVDDARFKRKLNQQIREQPRQVQIALGRTAEFLLGLIRKRTQKGKDADGNTFKKKYTPEYKEFRQMLSNMTQKASPKQSILFFANKFQNVKAVGNQKKRPFFLIGDREQKTLINFFGKELFKQNKLR